jgi:hypothetical protein
VSEIASGAQKQGICDQVSLSNCAQTSSAPSGTLQLYPDWSLDMALNETADWEFVAAQVARETDSEKLRELAAEFNRVLHKREQLRRQQRDKISLMAAVGSSIRIARPDVS